MPTISEFSSGNRLDALNLGVMFFSSLNQNSDYDPALRIALEAERVGLDALWIPERHYDPFGGLYPSPVVLVAYLAGRTERIALRAGSVVAPLTDPIRIAEEWAMVDRLSEGRAGIALATGWNPIDFATRPESFAPRREVTRRAIELVRRAWSGETLDIVTGRGEKTEVRTYPRPISGKMPLWVTSSGSPESIACAAETGSSLLTHLVDQSEERLVENIAQYRRAYRGDGAPHVTVMVHSYVAPTSADSLASARAALREYLGSALALDARSSGDVFDPADVDEILDYSLRRHESQSLIGDHESCRQRLDTLSSYGVDEVACVVDFGLDIDVVVNGLQRLAALREPA